MPGRWVNVRYWAQSRHCAELSACPLNDPMRTLGLISAAGCVPFLFAERPLPHLWSPTACCSLLKLQFRAGYGLCMTGLLLGFGGIATSGHAARKILITRNGKAGEKPEDDADEATNVEGAVLDEERKVLDRNEAESWAAKNNEGLANSGSNLRPKWLRRVERERATSFRTPPNLLGISHLLSP